MQSICSLKSLSAVAFGLVLASGFFPFASLANDSEDITYGLPGRRISGGVRNDACFPDFNQSVVAIIPHSLLGETAEARPIFWFSTPETTETKKAVFELFNSEGEPVYSSEISIANRQGISGFHLPESAPELVIDESYQWTLSVGCPSIFVDVGVQGWVRRVATTEHVSDQIITSSPLERVKLYEAAGLWHEQVTELISLRRNRPMDSAVQLEWTALMEAKGLSSEVSDDISDDVNAVDSPALSLRDD